MSEEKKAGRTSQILIRVSDEEAARIKERAEAAGMSASAYIRSRALADAGSPHAPAIDVGELRRLYTELHRCGTNVNQIAHSLNAWGVEGATASQISASLSSLENASDAISSTMEDLRK